MSFTPKAPDWEPRVRASFDAQAMMHTLGAKLTVCAPGRTEVEMPFNPAVTQQHGFLHAGAVTSVTDSACGFAAMTLMPAGAEVLTVELKISLLAPAKGERFHFTGEVIKPGRTLIFTEGRAFAEEAGERRLIATLSATMMTVMGRKLA